MNVPEAIRAIGRLGVDVYVARNHDLVLRARKRGVPIPPGAIVIAQIHRDVLVAFGLEWFPVKGSLSDLRL